MNDNHIFLIREQDWAQHPKVAKVDNKAEITEGVSVEVGSGPRFDPVEWLESMSHYHARCANRLAVEAFAAPVICRIGRSAR